MAEEIAAYLGSPRKAQQFREICISGGLADVDLFLEQLNESTRAKVCQMLAEFRRHVQLDVLHKQCVKLQVRSVQSRIARMYEVVDLHSSSKRAVLYSCRDESPASPKLMAKISREQLLPGEQPAGSRFWTELEVIERARRFSPTIIPILAVGHYYGHPFMVMSQYSGDLTAAGEFGGALFQSLVYGMLESAEAVHRAGYYHGDLKPGNFLVSKHEYNPSSGERMEVSLPILSDFESAIPVSGGNNAIGVTNPQIFTWQYAPAWADRLGAAWNMQAEQHTLAITLAELLTGELPGRERYTEFPNGAMTEHLKRHLESFDRDQSWGGFLDRLLAGEFASIKGSIECALREGLIQSDVKSFLARPSARYAAYRNLLIGMVGGLALGAMLSRFEDRGMDILAEVVELTPDDQDSQLADLENPSDEGDDQEDDADSGNSDTYDTFDEYLGFDDPRSDGDFDTDIDV